MIGDISYIHACMILKFLPLIVSTALSFFKMDTSLVTLVDSQRHSLRLLKPKLYRSRCIWVQKRSSKAWELVMDAGNGETNDLLKLPHNKYHSTSLQYSNISIPIPWWLIDFAMKAYIIDLIHTYIMYRQRNTSPIFDRNISLLDTRHMRICLRALLKISIVDHYKCSEWSNNPFTDFSLGPHQWPLLLTWINFNPSMDK